MEQGKALCKSGPQSAALTSEGFGKGMAIFEACFPRYRLGKTELDIWRFMLADLSEAEFVRGMKAFCFAHKEIFPNTNIVAHLRHYARKDPTQKTSHEAWSDVLRAVASVGSYGTPTFENVLTQKAVECVGWKNICLSETIGVERAHFLKAYEAIASREDYSLLTGFRNG